MLVTNQSLSIVKGDTLLLSTVVRATATTVLDVSGATFYFTVKKHYKDDDEEALFQKTSPSGGIVLTDAPHGEVDITIDPEDTKDHKVGDYVYDYQMKDVFSHIFTLARGVFRIDEEVTVAE